jgi:SAM-dependent methyltransferase
MFQFIKKIINKLFFFLPDSVLQSIYFETVSYFGRCTAKSFYLDRMQKNLLNLGSGIRLIKNFINVDFYLTSGIDYGADLRYPLKINDDSVDGIFCEHTLEHLTYKDVESILRECFRILKPEGSIRIIVPDLSLFINKYYNDDQQWFAHWERVMFTESDDPQRSKRRLRSPLEAISFVTQEYGHVSCWDFSTIKIYLERVGFQNITKTGFMSGTYNELFIDTDSEDRKIVSLYVEATKPNLVGQQYENYRNYSSKGRI